MPRAKKTYGRATLRTASEFVNRRALFKGSNIFSEWIYDYDNTNPIPHAALPLRYAVYSYGHHFPMYVYDCVTDQWFGNQDRYSQSTTQHQYSCRPDVPDHKPIKWVSTQRLITIVNFGVFKATAYLVGGELP